MNSFAAAEDWAGANLSRRVAFLNALRAEVGRRAPVNKAGVALVSDWDLLTARPEEIEAALAKAKAK